jgi:acetyl-CoA acetyltransferase family protein
VNQYCNAGLKAINMSSRAIKCGDGDIWMCAGVELMSHYGMGSDVQVAMEAQYPVRFTSRIQETGMTVPQGVCAEMISADYGHTREDLDKFGMWSMQKSVEARRKGWHDDVIVPFEYEWDGQKYTVDKDETLRDQAVDDPEAYWQNLQNLRPPFKPEDGMVTAGNSSQIVDGAAAVLLMNAKKAEQLGIEPMGRITACASAGGDPVPMLLAPIQACEKAMDRAGKKIDDFDILEPNEAFASPLLVFSKELGYDVDDPRINPTGGAIGMGHPIGASGVLWFAEMVHHLKRINGKAAMQMMCGGGGIGIATIVEAV